MFDKKAYQREYMRKKRMWKKSCEALAKEETAAPVLAEPTTEVQTGARGHTKGYANECSTVSGEARESTMESDHPSDSVYADSRGGSSSFAEASEDKHPIPEREWKYACDRAERARKYAEMFPNFVKPSEVKYQDPMWQWKNEVRGRFGGIIGGSLSGTRSGEKGN